MSSSSRSARPRSRRGKSGAKGNGKAAQQPASSSQPARPKLKLIPGAIPTGETKLRNGLIDESADVESAKYQPLGKRLLEAAQTKRLNVHSYDKLKGEQIRVIIVKPAEDPSSDMVVDIQTLSFEELEELYHYEALSYHWGEGDNTHPIFIQHSLTSQPQQSYNLNKVSDIAILLAKKRLLVKPNLYRALKHLRQKKDPCALWVDAVCIDQSSEEEKKEQVPNIAKVYNKADRVCIWLGSADHDGRTDRAMRFIQDIVKAYDLDNLIKPEKATCWSDLIYLMRKRWFSRRWVIQELALAKDAVVRCGERQVHWRDFADAIGLFDLHFKQIRQLFKDKEKFPNKEYDIITDLKPLGAKILVDQISNVFLRDTEGLRFEPQQTLETLISTLSTFETSDPRDTVNALLNIARETCPFSSANSRFPEDPNNPLPKPSYSKDLLEVYTDLVRWIVNHTGCLDIICRPWALPERKEKAKNGTYETLVTLPSWIKEVPESTHGKQTEGYNGRKNGDSFVGDPGTGCYNASHGKRAEVRFGMLLQNTAASSAKPSSSSAPASRPTRTSKRKRTEVVVSAPAKRRATARGKQNIVISVAPTNDPPPRTDTMSSVGSNRSDSKKNRDTSIYVKGFELCAVTWTTDPIPDGVIPEKGLSRLGWEKKDTAEFRTVPDRVWRTLVADRGLDGKNPPSWYHRACLRCLVQDTPNGHINTQALLNSEPPPPRMFENFLKRVQAVTWNRVVLEAESSEAAAGNPKDTMVGIGPPGTEVGDVVCILFGCSVPCILRWSNEQNGYQFIGEAFIYGKMYGEAVTGLSKRDLKEKTVEFRIL